MACGFIVGLAGTMVEQRVRKWVTPRSTLRSGALFAKTRRRRMARARNEGAARLRAATPIICLPAAQLKLP
jgi:hypothetical protein